MNETLTLFSKHVRKNYNLAVNIDDDDDSDTPMKFIHVRDTHNRKFNERQIDLIRSVMQDDDGLRKISAGTLRSLGVGSITMREIEKWMKVHRVIELNVVYVDD